MMSRVVWLFVIAGGCSDVQSVQLGAVAPTAAESEGAAVDAATSVPPTAPANAGVSDRGPMDAGTAADTGSATTPDAGAHSRRDDDAGSDDDDDDDIDEDDIDEDDADARATPDAGLSTS